MKKQIKLEQLELISYSNIDCSIFLRQMIINYKKIKNWNDSSSLKKIWLFLILRKPSLEDYSNFNEDYEMVEFVLKNNGKIIKNE